MEHTLSTTLAKQHGVLCAHRGYLMRQFLLLSRSQTTSQRQIVVEGSTDSFAEVHILSVIVLVAFGRKQTRSLLSILSLIGDWDANTFTRPLCYAVVSFLATYAQEGLVVNQYCRAKYGERAVVVVLPRELVVPEQLIRVDRVSCSGTFLGALLIIQVVCDRKLVIATEITLAYRVIDG